MNTEFFAFGEILWDCLPRTRHAGGAPFNVAAHLAHLGCPVALISAVGPDALGDEILKIARDKGVQTRFVARTHPELPTGTVQVAIDANGNATYEIVRPAAWDRIVVSAEAIEAVRNARAFVFGSLACRSSENRGELDRLLAIEGPMKFFDVNLRPPFADPALVIELARRADVIKLNDDELGQLAAWLRTGRMTADTPRTAKGLGEAYAVLANAANASRICVTRGAEGGALWAGGEFISVPAPKVTVRDTVGAGDAFTAGLMAGLIRGMALGEVLANACKLGAFVASQDGATPALPEALRRRFQPDSITS